MTLNTPPAGGRCKRHEKGESEKRLKREDRSRESEVRGQRSEVRGQRSEVGRQETEESGKGRRGEAESPKAGG